MRSVSLKRCSSRPCLEGGYEPGCHVLGANLCKLALNPFVPKSSASPALSCSPRSLLPRQAGPEPLRLNTAYGRPTSSAGVGEATRLCGKMEGPVAPTHTFNQSSCFQPSLDTMVRNTLQLPFLSLCGCCACFPQHRASHVLSFASFSSICFLSFKTFAHIPCFYKDLYPSFYSLTLI